MYSDLKKCMSCEQATPVVNEWRYRLCQGCLDYYLGIEIESLVEMTDAEQDMYWRLYEDEHKGL